MKIKHSISNPTNTGSKEYSVIANSVINNFPLSEAIRRNFERGTLIKATFELVDGNIITYEMVDEREQKS